MLILGINEGLNSSIAICDNGKIVFALQEERLSRVKEHAGFPHQAIQFTLDHLGLKMADFSRVVLSNRYSPSMSRENFLTYYDTNAKAFHELILSGGLMEFAKRLNRRLPDRIRQSSMQHRFEAKNRAVLKELMPYGVDSKDVVRTSHHRNHAASAYYGRRKNPLDKHLVLTLDGGGDEVCSHVYLAENGKMTLIATTPSGSSLGHIYSRVTHLMGMKPHEHEYKLMGMAPYADPDYAEKVAGVLWNYLDLDPKNPLCFKRLIPEPTTLCEVRLRKDLRGFRFDSIAAGVQQFCEELIIAWVKAVVSQTGVRNIVAAGGVFMNVKANKLIAELPEVDYYDVFPSCGDETLPFGGVWDTLFKLDPDMNDDIIFGDIYLGPESTYDLEHAKNEFKDHLQYEEVDDPESRIARLLSEGKVVARCTGRMEFGARALGNRSLLADPGNHGVIAVINRIIKQRDFWMPFAPAILREDVEKYIEIPHVLPRPHLSPFMMHTFKTFELRDSFIAGIHPYDKTARAQIVSKELNARFHRLIREFSKIKNKSVVLNTSFNLHGYPIVMGSRDAMDVMINSGIDYLMINHTLVTKKLNNNIS